MKKPEKKKLKDYAMSQENYVFGYNQGFNDIEEYYKSTRTVDEEKIAKILNEWGYESERPHGEIARAVAKAIKEGGNEKRI